MYGSETATEYKAVKLFRNRELNAQELADRLMRAHELEDRLSNETENTV